MTFSFYLCTQMYYKKNPESHPEYSTEWKMFWERRYHELASKGINPNNHDFKTEWAGFWNDRMKDIFSSTVENKKEALMKKHHLTKEDLENKRPVSPWEETAENNRGESSKTQCTVVGTLNALIEVESMLGALGPAVITLLLKAVSFSSEGKKTIDIFLDSDNLTLIRLSHDKLSGHSSKDSAGLQTKRQNAIECCKWLLEEVNKVRSNKQEYLGLDMKELSMKTIGMDTVQIAQQIALALLKEGESNVSEDHLQKILLAVSASHAKMMLQKTQVPEKIEVSSSTDKPGESVASGKPLFPSGSSLPKANKVISEPIKASAPAVLNEPTTSGALGQLMSAYDDDPPRDMEKLSLEDLVNLLSNFKDLSREEQRALTAYLKRLEATDSKKVTKLREMVQKNVKANEKAKQQAVAESRRLQVEKETAHEVSKGGQLSTESRLSRQSPAVEPQKLNSQQSPPGNRPHSQLSNHSGTSGRQSPVRRQDHFNERDHREPMNPMRTDMFSAVTDTFALPRESRMRHDAPYSELESNRMAGQEGQLLLDRTGRPIPHDREVHPNEPLFDRAGRPIPHEREGQPNEPLFDRAGRPIPRDREGHPNEPMFDRAGRPIPHDREEPNEPMFDRVFRSIPHDREGHPNKPMFDRTGRPIPRDREGHANEPIFDRTGRSIPIDRQEYDQSMFIRDGRQIPHNERFMHNRTMMDRDGPPLPYDQERRPLDHHERLMSRDAAMFDRESQLGLLDPRLNQDPPLRPDRLMDLDIERVGDSFFEHNQLPFGRGFPPRFQDGRPTSGRAHSPGFPIDRRPFPGPAGRGHVRSRPDNGPPDGDLPPIGERGDSLHRGGLHRLDRP